MAKRRGWTRRALAALTLLLACVVVGARLGGLHWLGDILALVSDYYALAALALLLAHLSGRSWRWAGLAGACLLLSVAQVFAYPRVGAGASPAQGPGLRLMVYNIYYLNQDLGAVVRAVERYDPDVLFLMEYSEAIEAEIGAAFADYPHRVVRTSRLTSGVAVFSRLPIESVEAERTPETRIPILRLRMRAGERAFTFVGGHPWAPQLPWAAIHRRQMGAIIERAAGAPHPLIVAGDFNAAPWSFTMGQLAERGGVRFIRRPLDLTKTWLGPPGFGLPLDHVLVSDEWQVVAQQYGPPGGSDHRSLIIDLRLRAGE